MNATEVFAALDKLNPDALFLDPREVFDAALIGWTATPDDRWPRKADSPPVAVYDAEKCIEAIATWLECDYTAAADYYYFNTEGAWVGEGTPVFTSTEPSE